MPKGIKIIFYSFIVVFFLAVTNPSYATHNPHSNDNIPEKNGTYDDPNHKGIKVRVFVHPEKPAFDSSAALVCSLEDPDSTTPVSKTSWHLPGSWIYNLNPDSVPLSVGSSNLATIVANGFNSWKDATGNKISFTRGADTTVARQAYDGRNIITWGRTSGSALGVTYVWYYSSTGLAVDVDTVMNKKFFWKWSNSNTCSYSESYDAENILNHELGHWIGLDDEYDAPNFQHATMYGYGSKGEVKKVTLEASDKSGAFSIYNP